MKLLLKNLLFILVVPGTAGVYLPLFLAQDRPAASGAPFFLALALLTLGAIAYLWCVWDFAVFGRGTPAPIDPPKKLVVRGLYRCSRNPLYIGLLTALAGWAVMFGGTSLLLYALGVAIFLHLFVVLYEEPHLRRVFGAEYQEYCEKVGRWLPRFRGCA